MKKVQTAIISKFGNKPITLWYNCELTTKEYPNRFCKEQRTTSFLLVGSAQLGCKSRRKNEKKGRQWGTMASLVSHARGIKSIVPPVRMLLGANCGARPN
jgi:hypothetical protein